DYPPPFLSALHDSFFLFFSNHTPTTVIYTLSLHDALPICGGRRLEGVVGTRAARPGAQLVEVAVARRGATDRAGVPRCVLAEVRSEEHTSELQSRFDLVCRLLLEKKKHDRSLDFAGRVYL